ncbi:MAG: hypothetical protein IPJ65_32950 [Archangiaceae bacterium]|nr:hypothetical protein [Archangiaceae bacterium]
MISALLTLTLLAADVTTLEPDPNEWPGEGERRTHFGIGARVHAGALDSVGGAALLLLSEVTGFVSVRVVGHHEVRVGWGLLAGWPDTVAGESNLSFRFNLTPRFSVGAGLFSFIGFYSLRGGVELPVGLRFGPTRRHEITFSVRAEAGGFNRGITFAWYDFEHLSFAYALSAMVGYSAIF